MHFSRQGGFRERVHSHRYKRVRYRVFIKYCVFSLVIFLNSASSDAALAFYLPSCGLNVKSGGVHTMTPRVKQSLGYILKSLKKNTIFNERPYVSMSGKSYVYIYVSIYERDYVFMSIYIYALYSFNASMHFCSTGWTVMYCPYVFLNLNTRKINFIFTYCVHRGKI